MSLTFLGTPCRILGKIEAERPCDLCGNCTLKTAVVVEVEGAAAPWEIGRDCAAQNIFGKKTAANARKVDKAVAAAEAAERNQCHIDINKAQRMQLSRNEANQAFNRTGRKLAGTFFAARGPFTVRVDGKDPADVEFFQRLGFTPVSDPVPMNCDL